MARQKAKEEGARLLNREKETRSNVDAARAEIEAWRAKQWHSWEEEAMEEASKVEAKVQKAPKPEEPKEDETEDTEIFNSLDGF